ncbi:MAG: GNAT family N-acetyltransferase, partial [Candidatus Omnitrophica bacterium]|nr:GNAT family N-acetyltransferase [Candidatus Omnitrophota bacterium]MBU2437034.1 GNAT family N-acetyltransferase [Candidatus Omnitrophota bacterium]
IHNWAVGNISLFFEEIDNRKICILSNFIIRIPFRGAGIASQLLEKTLYLCSKINVDEIKIVLSKGDEISHNLFFKLGFEII